MYLKLIKEDVEKIIGKEAKTIDILKCLLVYNGLNALLLYRISNDFYYKNHKILATIFRNRNIKKYGCDIDQRATLGKRIMIPHPNGIVIGKKTIIGNDVVIQHQVTCGIKNPKLEDNPVIGNNVFIGAGTKILGNLKISDNVIIGANSVVLKDIEEGSVVAGNPAKKIGECYENSY